MATTKQVETCAHAFRHTMGIPREWERFTISPIDGTITAITTYHNKTLRHPTMKAFLAIGMTSGANTTPDFSKALKDMFKRVQCGVFSPHLKPYRVTSTPDGSTITIFIKHKPQQPCMIFPTSLARQIAAVKCNGKPFATSHAAVKRWWYLMDACTAMATAWAAYLAYMKARGLTITLPGIPAGAAFEQAFVVTLPNQGTPAQVVVIKFDNDFQETVQYPDPNPTVGHSVVYALLDDGTFVAFDPSDEQTHRGRNRDTLTEPTHIQQIDVIDHVAHAILHTLDTL